MLQFHHICFLLQTFPRPTAGLKRRCLLGGNELFSIALPSRFFKKKLTLSPHTHRFAQFSECWWPVAKLVSSPARDLPSFLGEQHIKKAGFEFPALQKPCISQARDVNFKPVGVTFDSWDNPVGLLGRPESLMWTSWF